MPHTSVKKTFYFSIECKRSHISIVLIQKSKVLKCNKTTFGATLQETVLCSKMFCQVVHSGITSINNVIILSYILAYFSEAKWSKLNDFVILFVV